MKQVNAFPIELEKFLLTPNISIVSIREVNETEISIENINNKKPAPHESTYRPGNNRNFGTGHDVQELFISPGHFRVNI